MATACYRLTYDDSETAVNILRARFIDGAEELGDRQKPKRPKPAEAEAAPVPLSKTSPGPLGPWRRRPAVIERRVAGDLFLVNQATDSIYHLNGLADALWRLTAEPVSETEMIKLVAAAFPDAAREQIGRDIGTLVDSLVSKGLLERRTA